MRAIDADALLKELTKAKREVNCHLPDIVKLFKGLRDWIKDAPTLDVMPVKRGRWITEGSDLICPVCGAAYDEEILWMYRNESDQDCGLSYCPHCAAKLER